MHNFPKLSKSTKLYSKAMMHILTLVIILYAIKIEIGYNSKKRKTQYLLLYYAILYYTSKVSIYCNIHRYNSKHAKLTYCIK